MDKEKPEIEIPSIELLKMELARVESRRNFRKTLLNIAGVLIVAAAIAALIATQVFVLIRVNGSSMSPTFEAEEIIILRRTQEVKAGDTIGFYYGGSIFLKRVIGTAGDKIDIDQKGNVYVNDELLEEPYLKNKNLGKCELEFPYQVPEGMYFVLGDNRAVSLDSRIKSIGCVQSDQIVGRTVIRVWPLTRVEIMR
ncbi:MAG: signal peptidase I [Dorea sp.]|jgi:signal peptidase I|nr:signal peptidase I [Dorea sp.]